MLQLMINFFKSHVTCRDVIYMYERNPLLIQVTPIPNQVDGERVTSTYVMRPRMNYPNSRVSVTTFSLADSCSFLHYV